MEQNWLTFGFEHLERLEQLEHLTDVSLELRAVKCHRYLLSSGEQEGSYARRAMVDERRRT